MEEIWKDIVGYEGHYQVSNLGNVKSLNYQKHGYSQNLVPKKNNCGRLWVELRIDGVKKQMLVHRLVAMAFLENADGLPEINHKDEDPTNNVVDNLEWCDRLYNARYSHNRHPERHRKVRVRKTRKLTETEIEQLSTDGKVIKRWKNVGEITRETGWNQWSITQCCDGKRHKAYGFKWQYAI